MAKKKNRKKHNLKHGRSPQSGSSQVKLESSQPAGAAIVTQNASLRVVSELSDAARDDVMKVSLLGLALILAMVLLWYLYVATPLGTAVNGWIT